MDRKPDLCHHQWHLIYRVILNGLPALTDKESKWEGWVVPNGIRLKQQKSPGFNQLSRRCRVQVKDLQKKSDIAAFPGRFL